MNTNQQEQVDTEQEQVEEKEIQLLEIYKLHAQLANSVSTRRTTMNRFYQVILSGLMLISFAILQRKISVIPDELSIDVINQAILDNIIGYFAVYLGIFGSIFSVLWSITIDAYLRVNSRKYEVLKKLEAKLEYQFFTQEWELLGEKGKHDTYKRLALNEICVPLAFNVFFAMVTCLGILKKSNDRILLISLIMHILFLAISFLISFRPEPWAK